MKKHYTQIKKGHSIVPISRPTKPVYRVPAVSRAFNTDDTVVIDKSKDNLSDTIHKSKSNHEGQVWDTSLHKWVDEVKQEIIPIEKPEEDKEAQKAVEETKEEPINNNEELPKPEVVIEPPPNKFQIDHD